MTDGRTWNKSWPVSPAKVLCRESLPAGATACCDTRINRRATRLKSHPSARGCCPLGASSRPLKAGCRFPFAAGARQASGSAGGLGVGGRQRRGVAACGVPPGGQGTRSTGGAEGQGGKGVCPKGKRGALPRRHPVAGLPAMARGIVCKLLNSRRTFPVGKGH